MNPYEEALAKAKQLFFQNPDVKAKLDDLTHISGFKDLLNTFPLLWYVLKHVVYTVEAVYQIYDQIPKDQRIDLAAQFLDDLITFSGWLSIFEPFDGMLWKMLISAAVQAMNDWYGHNWFDSPVAVKEFGDIKKIANKM